MEILSRGFAAKLKSRQPLLGSWLTVPDHNVAEILSQGPVDFLLADGEHAPIAPDNLSGLLLAADRWRRAVIFRVRSNHDDLIKAALDSGASGVMVPMVNDVADACRAVGAAKYPPTGRRGIGPWRASNFYQHFVEYLERANEETVLIAQIETAEGLSNAAEIAAVASLDALYVGPADLAASLGLPIGELHSGFIEACKHVADSARQQGKPAGIDVSSLDYLGTYIDLGFSFFTYGTDVTFLVEGSQQAACNFRRTVASGVG